MAYDFSRSRLCVQCGAKTKADRATPREQVLCMACRYPKQTGQASKPEGEMNHE